MADANKTLIDSIRRDDMKPAPIASTRKPRTVRMYCALVGSRYVSRFHDRKRTDRAVRLARSWGLDAYRSSPVERKR